MGEARIGQKWRHPLEPRPTCEVIDVRLGCVWVLWENGIRDALADTDLAALGYKLVSEPSGDSRETG